MWSYRSKFVFVCLAAAGWFALFGGYVGCSPNNTNEPAVENSVEKKTEKKTEAPAETGKEQTKPDEGNKTEPKTESRVEPRTEPQTEPQKEKVIDHQEPPPKDIGRDAGEKLPEIPKEVLPEAKGPEPTVQITEPKDGDFVKGSISVKVDASITGAPAEPTIARVELHLDGRKIDEKASAPYEFTYNTQALKDGAHKLAAIAFTSWNKQKTHEITIKTVNFGPKITFVKPKLNSATLAKFDIEVQVTDSVGLKANGVQLIINGTPVTWTSTTPTYKASYDASALPFDSFPVQVKAENTQGITSEEIIWVIHDPAVGPKKAGEECDNSDAQKRCIANHSCLLIGGKGAKATCYLNCYIGGLPGQCPAVSGKNVRCQPSWQGSLRGTCQTWEAAPGSLYSVCGGAQTCTDPNHVCVGATGAGKSFCLKGCSGSGGTCPDPGFFCAPLSNGGGACIEKCQQSCAKDADCSQGQTCKSGTCAGAFCANYGTCQSLSGLTHNICI